MLDELVLECKVFVHGKKKLEQIVAGGAKANVSEHVTSRSRRVKFDELLLRITIFASLRWIPFHPIHSRVCRVD